MNKNIISINNTTITAEEQLRVATFNILNSPHLQAERLQYLIEEINNTKPDILNLQEVNIKTNPNIIQHITEHTDLKHVGQTTPLTHSNGNIIQVNATFTKSFTTSFQQIDLTHPTFNGLTLDGLKTHITFNNKNIYIYNAHLAWGSDNEWMRLRQAEKIVKDANNVKNLDPKAVIIFTGDFNSNPDSTVAQYLKGNITATENQNTFWVDAWEACGADTNIKNTTNAQSMLGIKTATSVGIPYPTLVPERRIDYIFVHGFAYGRSGHPLTFNTWGTKTYKNNLTISDHIGIYSDILITQ